MNLKNKRQMAARLLKVGYDRVWFDPTRSQDLKEAITKDSLRKLLREGALLVKQKKGVSRGRNRTILAQKRKGRRDGPGSRKGTSTSRLSRKSRWIQGIRAQRALFNELIDAQKITPENYRHLRIKAKGGFFRSRRHIKLYITEHNLWVSKQQ